MGIWKKGFLPPPWGWVRGSGAEAAQASWAPVRQQAAALVPRLGAPSWHHTAPTVSLESQALGSGGRSPGALPPLEPWASHSHFWVCFLIHKMGLILSLGAAVTPAPMGRTKQQARHAAAMCLSLCVRNERETGAAISVCRWGRRETQARSGRILGVRFNCRYCLKLMIF